MKGLLIIALIGTVAMSQLIVPEMIKEESAGSVGIISKADVLDFLHGVAEGVELGIDWSNIQNCIHDEVQIAKDIQTAMDNFGHKTVGHVEKALQAISDALHTLPKAIQDCKAACQDLGTLKSMIEKFANPGKFVWVAVKNLILHGIETWGEIKLAKELFQERRYEASGEMWGVILTKVFLRSTPASSVAQANTLNAKPKLWKAKHYERWDGLTLWDVKQMFMGLKEMDTSEFPEKNVTSRNDLPDNFDSRTQWPGCVHPIMDQGQCGSCWAFGATEAMSDRFCIASKGSVNVVLSPQYQVSCDRFNLGCNGGFLTLAWRFLTTKGVPTDACWPYQSGQGKSPKCSEFDQCWDGSAEKFYYIQKGSVGTFKNPEKLKNEIIGSGPVETGFTVYADFLEYESGIYSHQSGGQLGGHAVKIIGWGLEGGVNYWICANSWSEEWGEKGFFRIAEGECGIENAIAGDPDFDRTFKP